MNTKDFIALEEQYGAHNYHPLNVVIERAEGVWVYDVDGKRYLDCLSAYSAVNQGHVHPRILQAMLDQAKKLTLTSRAFRNDQLVGVVSVVERDDLDDCDHFTPWIAAMIVDPNLRGRGIGSVLLESALEFCHRARVPRVFLWTHDMSEWYRRIGWAEEETRNFRGVRITIQIGRAHV